MRTPRGTLLRVIRRRRRGMFFLRKPLGARISACAPAHGQAAYESERSSRTAICIQYIM